MALGMMIDGNWQSTRANEDNGGRFVRPSTTFRNWIRADGSTEFQPEAGRYHLYVSYARPWAHRTLLLRKLKGLEDAIGISVVDPFMGEDGWFFSDAPGAIRDSVNGAQFVREIYAKADPQFTGRVTVPILWDKKNETVVNNESREIIKMLDLEFQAIATNPNVGFYPADLADEIEATLDAIYNPINNGVYRSGFASSQEAHAEAVTELFAALDHSGGLVSVYDAVSLRRRILRSSQNESTSHRRLPESLELRQRTLSSARRGRNLPHGSYQRALLHQPRVGEPAIAGAPRADHRFQRAA